MEEQIKRFQIRLVRGKGFVNEQDVTSKAAALSIADHSHACNNLAIAAPFLNAFITTQCKQDIHYSLLIVTSFGAELEWAEVIDSSSDYKESILRLLSVKHFITIRWTTFKTYLCCCNVLSCYCSHSLIVVFFLRRFLTDFTWSTRWATPSLWDHLWWPQSSSDTFGEKNPPCFHRKDSWIPSQMRNLQKQF